jgi:tetratricopeptide (TPR) repeat protein
VRRAWPIPLAIALVTAAVFAPALRNGFVWDDDINLLANAGYRGLGWPQLHWMLTATTMGHWIPLTWLTFGLDSVLWGMNPAGYHVTNIVLHAANAAVFFFVARRLLGAGMVAGEGALRLGAAAAALVFALHPLRAESVAWVTERRDVLAGLFFLLAVLLYVKAAAAEGRERRRRLAASAGCYALALLSKSIVMTLPLVLLVLDAYPLRRLAGHWRARLVEKLPYGVLAAVVAGIAFYQVHARSELVPLAQYSPAARAAMTGYSLWFYLWKTIVPVSLSPLYPLPARVSLLEPRFLLSALAVAAITAALWSARGRGPAGLAAGLAYAVQLAPVVGLVHAGPQLVADRYSYLACLGWAVLAGAGVSAAARAAARGILRPAYARLAVAGVAVWAIGLAGLTVAQVQVWRDADTLWSVALDADPACEVCHANLGSSLERRGLDAAAIRHFEAALALAPGSVVARRNLAMTLLKTGRADEAAVHFRQLLARAPGDPGLRHYLGLAETRALHEPPGRH